jgi:hypothetical protein
MIDDMLKESWVYKEWQRETTAKVTEQVMKQNIVSIVRAKFPSLVALTQERLEPLKTPEQLRRCLVQMVQAREEEEARGILLTRGNEQS